MTFVVMNVGTSARAYLVLAFLSAAWTEFVGCAAAPPSGRRAGPGLAGVDTADSKKENMKWNDRLGG